jgi:hypothetical protein
VAGPHRLALAGPAGLLWLLEDGASRFYRWRQQGIFERLLAEVHRRADACGELDWLCHYVDGSVVRAHQHAAGARHQPSQDDRKRGSSTRQMRHWGPAVAG